MPALQEYAARLPESGALDVSVTVWDLPPLPAAVEVAAYRIVTEALNNASQHAHARRTTVAIEINGGRLRVEVVDDGVGLPAQRDPRTTGVGLAAMTERAAELGGTCSVGHVNGGGTAVVAELPLRRLS